MSGVDYQQAGVDIDAGNETVRRIKALAKRTYTAGVLSGRRIVRRALRARRRTSQDPVLVASADGVGTKLKVAFMTGVHDTIGVDLVNHCVNDILVQGARPLFFLDYLATGRLAPDVAEQIVTGVARACEDNGCALLGGETAEMPGFYADGEYDVAGFIVGLVARARVIDGRDDRGRRLSHRAAVVRPAHQRLFAGAEDRVRAPRARRREPRRRAGRDGWRRAAAAASVVSARCGRRSSTAGWIKGMAHITGGGIPENLPRTLPDGRGFRIDDESWTVPPLFRWLQRAGGVDDAEMFRAFNMGVGLILVCAASHADDVLARLRAAGERPWLLGHVT